MKPITRRELLKWGAGAAVGAVLLRQGFAGLSAGPSARPPNILLIYIDDLGWKDVSYMGSKYYQTPHIDKLAAGGVVFMQAYSNGPSCQPSRACLMSGQYGPRHGVYIVGRSNRGNKKAQKLIPTPNTTTLRADIVTMAEALKAAGYRTAHMGKWHLGREPELGPKAQGFDVNIAGGMAGQPRSYFSPYNMPDIVNGPDGEYLTDRLTEEAVKFMTASRDRPWFLYLPHYAVHVPLQAKEKMIAKYKAKAPDGGQNNPTYAAMIESTDQGVGRLMAALDELKLSGNTVVLFYSDNGGQLGITEQKPLRAGKGHMYEGGIRVPLAVRWPGVTQAGRKCSVPVIGTDLYPTFLQIAGGKKPDGHVLDGESIVPLLKGDAGRLKREALYWHFPCYQPGSRGTFRITPCSVVRKGDFKLTEHFEDGRLEMYNLKDDISETTDLAAKMPDKAKELQKLLADWRKSTNAPVPDKPNPQYVAPEAAPRS
ncbi:MAG TPA: sulfatase [Phycisphaerae bacterium]|nr:sulfatase [Phycisphaerae bacterium]